MVNAQIKETYQAHKQVWIIFFLLSAQLLLLLLLHRGPKLLTHLGFEFVCRRRK